MKTKDYYIDYHLKKITMRGAKVIPLP